MELTFRLATVEDFEFVYSGRQQIADADSFVIPNPQGDKQRVLQAIQNKKVNLALLEEKPVGFVWFVVDNRLPFGVDFGPKTTGNYCYVSYIFVCKEQRGKGIGSALYTFVEEYCRKNKIGEIIIDIDTPNLKSQEFHKKMGFTPFVTLYEKKVTQ